MKERLTHQVQFFYFKSIIILLLEDEKLKLGDLGSGGLLAGCGFPVQYPPAPAYPALPLSPLLPSWCLHSLLLQSQANLLHHLHLQAAQTGTYGSFIRWMLIIRCAHVKEDCLS